jgi:hypothetical protein
LALFSFLYFTLKNILIRFVYIKKNMKKIVVKEIDRLNSTIHKGKTISEYLIYLIENDVKLACYSEFGEKAKNLMVNQLILENINLNTSLEDIIQEVSFEEVLNY